MPVTIELSLELEGRLRDEAARQGIEPQAYVARAVEQYLRRSLSPGGNGGGASTLPPREAELLQEINAGLPDETWAEYRFLIAKRTDGTLTQAEHQTLVRLSDQVEEAHARRMQRVAELARLRGVPLSTMARTLGIPSGSRA